MRYNREAAADDWQLFEIVLRNGAERPCSDAYATANDEELADVFDALRKLRASGFPPDRNRGNPELETVKYKCHGAHKSTAFIVLKAKPSGWRLYFYIKEREHKQAEFLHAVHKKKWKRDDDDFNRCCALLAAAQGRNGGCAPLFIPDR